MCCKFDHNACNRLAHASHSLLLLLLPPQVGLDGFYSTSRANRCVVCGQEQHYLRYRVVPACYRCGGLGF